ncbi:MAG: hypothetical protein ACYCY8_12350 [Burkholderiales bacterium]
MKTLRAFLLLFLLQLYPGYESALANAANLEQLLPKLTCNIQWSDRATDSKKWPYNIVFQRKLSCSDLDGVKTCELMTTTIVPSCPAQLTASDYRTEDGLKVTNFGNSVDLEFDDYPTHWIMHLKLSSDNLKNIQKVSGVVVVRQSNGQLISNDIEGIRGTSGRWADIPLNCPKITVIGTVDDKKSR